MSISKIYYNIKFDGEANLK